MQRKTFSVLAAVLAVASLTPTNARADNHVVNSSFEDLSGNFSGDSCNYMQIFGGSTAIAGWTVDPYSTPSDLAWAKSPTCDHYSAADGLFAVDLTGFGADSSAGGALTQTMHGFVAGQQYQFSMDVFSNGPNPTVTLQGSSYYLTLSAGTSFTVGGTLWTPETATFTSLWNGDVFLKIANEFDGQTIDFIDNVQVNGPEAPVPEPAALLLLATGLVSVAGIVRRRVQTRN